MGSHTEVEGSEEGDFSKQRAVGTGGAKVGFSDKSSSMETSGRRGFSSIREWTASCGCIGDERCVIEGGAV